MRLLLASALLTSVLVAAPALALTQDDRTFLTKDVQGARYELTLAKLAETRASQAPVRSYAHMIARDHETANAELARLARSQGVKAPTEMTSEDVQTLAKLKGLSGSAFDKAYLDEMTRINAEDATEAEREKASTHDQSIVAYIRRFASMDNKHKKVGEELRAKFG